MNLSVSLCLPVSQFQTVNQQLLSAYGQLVLVIFEVFFRNLTISFPLSLSMSVCLSDRLSPIFTQYINSGLAFIDSLTMFKSKQVKNVKNTVLYQILTSNHKSIMRTVRKERGNFDPIRCDLSKQSSATKCSKHFQLLWINIVFH